MKNLKDNKGITLISLIVTIIVLSIIVSISITKGSDMIRTSKAENVETNMLTIKAKAKEYMENVESLNWTANASNENEEYGGLSTKEGKNRKELTGNKYQLTLIEDQTKYNNFSNWYESGYTYYALEKKALDKMNLSNLYEENKVYIIRYPLQDGDTKNLEIDIIYTNGIQYKKVTFYKLSDLQEVL